MVAVAVAVERIRPDPAAHLGQRIDEPPHPLETLVLHGDILSGDPARLDEAAGVPRSSSQPALKTAS
ncbi:hypothetical protein E2C06_32540 [Dankookia rubra]|uniref:Uncharacterized protein n=1 Tax=Dankookia rubra TaxID=1442381 RepID=A0A4R5Q7B6_9PROT|nr:hypothetical protein E2C06_32540 [Dankookia rubra]